MKVEIKFKGPISRRIHGDSVIIEIGPESSLMAVLEEAIKKISFLQSIWRDPQEIDRDSLILCNNIDIAVLGGLEMVMNEGDILTILPLVHGG